MGRKNKEILRVLYNNNTYGGPLVRYESLIEVRNNKVAKGIKLSYGKS